MTISVGIQNNPSGLNLNGIVNVVVIASPTPKRIEYWLDNTLMWAPSTLETSWAWDTTKEGNGTHVVRVEAVYKTRRSKAQIAVTTANGTVTTTDTFGVATFGNVPLGLRLKYRIAEFFGKAPKNM